MSATTTTTTTAAAADGPTDASVAQMKLDGASFVLSDQLPEEPEFQQGIRRAPDRGLQLSPKDIKVRVRSWRQ